MGTQKTMGPGRVNNVTMEYSSSRAEKKSKEQIVINIKTIKTSQ
jgi:hypothetical protein